MNKMIKKEIKRTTIEVKEVSTNNEGDLVGTQLPTIEVLGSVTKERANKLARKEYPTVETVVVGKIKENVKVYEMPVDRFIELATEKVTEVETEEA